LPEDPRECVDAVLRSLRDAGIGWIAEEIDAEILAGRQVEREIRIGSRPVQREVATEEYTSSEQLELVLRVVLEYAQVAHELWQATTDFARERLNVGEARILDVDTGQFIQPFSTDFVIATEKLEAIVRSLADECGISARLGERISQHPAPRSLLRVHER